MTPQARQLLALLAEGWHAEREEDGPYYGLIQRRRFMEGRSYEFGQAVMELRDLGLADFACNGSGSCWINDAGIAALKSSPSESVPREE